MQGNALSILVDEQRVNDLLKQKTGAMAFFKSICATCCFIVFILLYTGLALAEQLKVHRTYEGYIRRRFDEYAPMPLREVNSIDQFWNYTERTMFPAIYGNDTGHYYFPGRTNPVFHPIDEQNRILGSGARLKMVRIMPNEDCEIRPSYMSAFSTCYGPYKPEVVVTKTFGPVDNTGQPVFQYTPAQAGEHPFVGSVSTYEPGGYAQLMSADKNFTDHQFRIMIDNRWIDEGARALFYEFTLYNFNLALYAVCSICFEVSPSGSWVKSFKVDILTQRYLNPLGNGTDADFALLGLDLILVIFVMWYLFEEMSEFLGYEKDADAFILFRYKIKVKWEYFMDSWNILDWMNLTFIIVVMGYKINTWGLAGSMMVSMDDQTLKASTFTDLTSVATNARMIRSLTAFNSVLIWFKAVKYITIIPYITLFMQTVTVAEKFLVSFIVMFCTSMIGFSLAFNSAFGERLFQFRDPIKAYFYLLRCFFGDSRVAVVYDAAPFLGSLLIILFVLNLYFVTQQLFQAIMISSLSDAKAAQGLKGNKEFAKTMEKATEAWSTFSEWLHLDERYRSCVPGLYSRLKKRKHEHEKKEKLRDEWQQEKNAAERSMELQPVEGEGGARGRRQKRKKESLQEDDEISSGEDSEADLGRLRNQEQLTGGDEEEQAARKAESERGGANGHKGRSGGGTGFSFQSQDSQPEFAPEAQHLLFEATRHVVAGIVDHTRGARKILFSDMDESREVLVGIGNVLDVLGRRSKSLEAQQIELLRHY